MRVKRRWVNAVKNYYYKRTSVAAVYYLFKSSLSLVSCNPYTRILKIPFLPCLKILFTVGVYCITKHLQRLRIVTTADSKIVMIITMQIQIHTPLRQFKKSLICQLGTGRPTIILILFKRQIKIKIRQCPNDSMGGSKSFFEFLASARPIYRTCGMIALYLCKFCIMKQTLK